jgi:hypothetical protein
MPPEVNTEPSDASRQAAAAAARVEMGRTSFSPENFRLHIFYRLEAIEEDEWKKSDFYTALTKPGVDDANERDRALPAINSPRSLLTCNRGSSESLD